MYGIFNQWVSSKVTSTDVNKLGRSSSCFFLSFSTGSETPVLQARATGVIQNPFKNNHTLI